MDANQWPRSSYSKFLIVDLAFPRVCTIGHTALLRDMVGGERRASFWGLEERRRITVQELFEHTRVSGIQVSI